MQVRLGTLIALIFSAAVFAQGTVNWSFCDRPVPGAMHHLMGSDQAGGAIVFF